MSLKTDYRIVLADDHIPFRQGLKRILEEETDLKVVGEAGDGLELIALLEETAPHMVILDLSMPNMDGFEAAREIKRKYPEVSILILTMHKEEDYVYQAVSAGARGYVVKENADTELFHAIKSIREGDVYFPAPISEKIYSGPERLGDYGETSPPF
jgi:DNA-binding NarL/FixJ family response regulator